MRAVTDWRNETAADVGYGNWEAEESRSARHTMTELQRADTGRLAGGVLIIGDKEDARDE